MRKLPILILLSGAIASFCMAEERAVAPEPTPLSTGEADAIVEVRMNARAAAETARREALEAEAAYAEWEAAKGDGTKTIYRRVAPPPAPTVTRQAETVQHEWTEAEIAEFLRQEAERKPSINISLSATVYDREITEIRLWHEGEQYRALSNVAFNHLQFIGNFEDETAYWSFFGMVDAVDSEEESRIAAQARAFGYDYTPRPRPDKTLFASLEEPEYLLLAERGQTVPEAVIAQLDAIHVYYLTNERRLAIEHQRATALAEAQRKWREENPEPPKDTVINFWPIRSNSERVSPVRATTTTRTISEEVSR